MDRSTTSTVHVPPIKRFTSSVKDYIQCFTRAQRTNVRLRLESDVRTFDAHTHTHTHTHTQKSSFDSYCATRTLSLSHHFCSLVSLCRFSGAFKLCTEITRFFPHFCRVFMMMMVSLFRHLFELISIKRSPC